MKAEVVAVHRSSKHGFSKQTVLSVDLIAGLGIAEDAHLGVTVQHRYDKRKNPTKLNLRQVHLLAEEFLGELGSRGFAVQPGEMGENLTTCGLDLLSLPVGTRLQLGSEAVVELTGLRKPCVLIDRFQAGLLAQCMQPAEGGRFDPRAGVMSVVVQGGLVRAGDCIQVAMPSEPHQRMTFV